MVVAMGTLGMALTMGALGMASIQVRFPVVPGPLRTGL
jgi:hypothetical protein